MKRRKNNSPRRKRPKVTRHANAARHAKATTALLSNFLALRILHYAAAKPVRTFWILEALLSHGFSVNVPTLNRILVRMARAGWLKTKSPSRDDGYDHRAYAITAKGHQALTLARERLKDLVRMFHQ
jgi:DNA-binding PadR family transcriptional regulator